MKKYDFDLVVLMKKIYLDNGNKGFIPEKIVEGYYDPEEMIFIDFDGAIYYHIIEEPETYGFYARESYSSLKKDYKHLSLNQIKNKKFKTFKNDALIYLDEESTEFNIPIIGEFNIETKTIDQIFDGDIMTFYCYNYPEYFNALNNILEKNNDKEEIISQKTINNTNILINVPSLYNEITKSVIDQEEPIKKILTAIWKQYSDFSDKKSRNILINGSTGVGKTETFRVLSRLLDVPVVIVSATEYTATGYIGKNVDNMLIDLIKKANGDIKKAERGILIIDEIDKLAETGGAHSGVNQRDVQEALLKILEDGIFDVEINNKDYQFDTSKLMVVGMGSWSRIDLTPKTPVGFGSKTVKKTYKDITREDIVKNGIIPELVGRFPTIVQMNELDYDSFIKILNSPFNTISINKKFLEKQGIELTVDDSAINAIAEKASKNNYGARGLDEIVENALSKALYEIASNPEKYKELFITSETIEDNNKYNLIEKEQIKKLCKK